LVAQGVLQQGPRNSAIVPHLARRELSELTIVRCALEGRATREAASRRHDDATLRKLKERLATMQSLIKARKLESYLEHHRKFHFGIYAMSGVPLLVETIENMWLRCGPVLSFVIPEYVVLLKGWDHHTAALKAIIAGDADGAEREIVADITEAAHYLASLADATGQLRRPAG
jgi:DNA-binding GntR family transcriptional regulator